MPLEIQTVIVFGDSLSDIGKKWTSASGKAARLSSQMYVSATGRFSDCRNWTDFMFEEAGGRSLISDDADSSYAASQMHMTLTANSRVTSGKRPFGYANYAEGGACGDTPTEKSAFLGTFKDQVDEFEADLRRATSLGNTLFIIWFGANDLYTANRPDMEMGKVASVIAETQRTRLKVLAAQKATACKFIFCDLARPLTSVRYSMRLKLAKRDLKAKIEPRLPSKFRDEGYTPISGDEPWYVELARGNKDWAAKELLALDEQMKQIKALENGVMLFNSMMKIYTETNGDTLVAIGSCITEDAVRALVRGNYKLKKGAAPKPAVHVSAAKYDLLQQDPYFAANITTIDEVHPSDVLYRLIWKEIYRQGITKADCTFGNLTGVTTPTLLSALAKTAS
jgi:hypothetical protein